MGRVKRGEGEYSGEGGGRCAGGGGRCSFPFQSTRLLVPTVVMYPGPVCIHVSRIRVRSLGVAA